MIKRLTFLALGLCILYLVGYRLWYGYFPPETPHKIIGRYLKEPIPRSWKVAFFYQQWSPTQSDGILKAILEVPEEDLAIAEEYVFNSKHFSNTNELKKDTCFIKSMMTDDLTKMLNEDSNGLFTCNVDEHILKDEKMGDRVFFDNSKVLILDKPNKRLLMYILYM